MFLVPVGKGLLCKFTLCDEDGWWVHYCKRSHPHWWRGREPFARPALKTCQLKEAKQGKVDKMCQMFDGCPTEDLRHACGCFSRKTPTFSSLWTTLIHPNQRMSSPYILCMGITKIITASNALSLMGHWAQQDPFSPPRVGLQLVDADTLSISHPMVLSEQTHTRQQQLLRDPQEIWFVFEAALLRLNLHTLKVTFF